MIRKHLYTAFALLLVVIQWAFHQNDAVMSAAGRVPEDAIRLRILANSDTAEDQWLKRKVRDEVVAYVHTLTDEMDSIETARQRIPRHMPEIERRVEQRIAQYGFSYHVDVYYGQVPFPTKVYGNRRYPAGVYEALRITIGEGAGANWWCVLFPPLCFVDTANADTRPPDGGEEERAGTDAPPEDAHAHDADDAAGADGELEVRFFLVDWFDRVISKLKEAVQSAFSS